jgi:ribosomal protein L16 Arg81 hydroxylase
MRRPTENTPLSEIKSDDELIISIKSIQETHGDDRRHADNDSSSRPETNGNTNFSAEPISQSEIGAGLPAIAAMLAPVNWSDFLRDKWSKAFLIVKGETSKFDGLFSWGDLNSALEQHRLFAPRFRIVKKGRHLSETAYTTGRPALEGEAGRRPDARRIYAELRQGATLVLDSVDEISASVSTLCESLTRTFLSHCAVNAYATWGEEPGFGVHWDDHDVFVLQVAGQKYWKIYPMTRRSPLRRDADDKPPSQVLWEGIVEQGDLIYIPRGQWHEAAGVGVPTLHLTFGIRSPTGTALLSWLVDELQSEEIWRQDLPLFSDAGRQDAHAALLRESIERALAQGICARYSAALAGTMGARPHFSFPEGVYDRLNSDVIRKIRFSGMTFSNLHVAEGQFSFDAIGRSWTFHNSLFPVLKPLLDGEIVDVESLPALAHGVSPKRLDDVIARLLHEGLLSAHRDI